jgi:short-subunit dehydrogenase
MRNLMRPSARGPVGSALAAAALAAAGGGIAAFLAARTLVRYKRHFDLKGRNALVVGASHGIGREIARELAGRGANVAIVGRNAVKLRAVEGELAHLGVRVMALPGDVTDPDQVGHVVRQVREKLGPIDVLVNNAATIIIGPASQMELKDYHDAMAINFEAPLRFIYEVMPEMRQRKSGRIVNVASFGGKIPAPHLAPYAASKFALVGLSETLRAELSADNVFVTTVCPGLVSSGSSINAVFKGQAELEHKWFTIGDNAPLITITPEKLARKIVHACQVGAAELIAPFPARVQTILHGLFPGINTEMAAVVNAMLPGPSDTNDRVMGRDLEDGLDPLTASRQKRAESKYQKPEDGSKDEDWKK